MTNPPDINATRTELDGRWWQRIRRAFGIPDLVTDEHARTLVNWAIMPAESRIDPLQVAETVRKATLDLASQGRLDDLCSEQTPALWRALGYSSDTVDRVTAQAKSTLHGADEVRPVAEQILGRLRDSLKAQPFERDGFYFQ